MTTKRKSLIDRVASLPEGLLDDVEELHEGGVYHAAPTELKAVDEPRAQIARGEVATDEEVEKFAIWLDDLIGCSLNKRTSTGRAFSIDDAMTVHRG